MNQNTASVIGSLTAQAVHGRIGTRTMTNSWRQNAFLFHRNKQKGRHEQGLDLLTSKNALQLYESRARIVTVCTITHFSIYIILYSFVCESRGIAHSACHYV